MVQTLIDTLGNTITFNYDETTDVVTVTNSSLDNTPMELLKNNSEDVDPNVVYIAGTDMTVWSDDETKKQLINFWVVNKKEK
jgi:hypothetical protein